MRDASANNIANNAEEPTQKSLFLLPLGLSVLALGLLGWLYKKYFKTRKEYSAEDFQFALNNLKLQYPEQNYETWLQIAITVNSLMEKQEPRRPGVLLAIKSMKYQYTNLERELASMINEAVQSQGDYLELTEDFMNDQQKSITEILDKFDFHFENGGKVVVIQNIDKITNHDVLNLLHSMCDNDYAQHKRVCFIFTVSLPQSNSLGYYQQNPETIRNSIFSERWAHIPVDKRRALVARIGAATSLWL